MRPLLVLIVLLFFTFSCADDETSLNPLEDSGVLGLWEIESRGINNVSSTEAFCCESILLSEDTNLNDLKGTYYYDYGTVTNGTFELNVDNSTILFRSEDDTEDTFNFTIEDDLLEIYFFVENDRNWSRYSKTNNN